MDEGRIAQHQTLYICISSFLKHSHSRVDLCRNYCRAYSFKRVL